MRDLHGPVDGLAVFLGVLRAKVRAIGKAAAVYEAPHRHVRRRLDALRQYGEPSRERLPLELADVASRQKDLACGRLRKAREQPQERRFTRAVRPDDGRAAARFDGEREVREDRRMAHPVREMICREYRRHNCLLSRNKKNGAPSAAMMMPTGSSTGAKATRANVSL